MNPVVPVLIEKVSVLVRKNEEFRNRTGLAFNVFRVCGVNHYETMHSAILAALLDPCGTHGMETAFLRAFLDDVVQESNCAVDVATVVRTEISVDSGETKSASPDSRLDILVEDKATHFCLVIENKIYAVEQPGQMARYRAWLERQHDGWKNILLFLTLDGHMPTTDSKGDNGDVLSKCASWHDDIVPWLHKCARLAVDRPFVRESILQYINLINQLSGESTMDNEQRREIVEAATANASALRGAVELFRQKAAIYNHVAGKIAADLKSRLSNNEDWAFEKVQPDPYGRKADFIVLRHKRSNWRIRIAPEQTEMRNFFVGVACEDAPEKFQKSVRAWAAGHPGWHQTEWWPAWKYLPDSLLDWQGDFLADYLEDDKRRVIDSILETLSDFLPCLDAIPAE